MSGTQGTGGADEGEARTRELFRRASAVSQEWADVRAGGGLPDGAVTERLLRELADAERDRDGAARRASRMARGTLLAARHLADATHGGAADPAGDRAEAIVLLREAREEEPVTERETRSRTAVTKLLIRLLLPRLPDLAFQGRQDMIDVLTVGATFMTPGGVLREELAEVGALLTELTETADPADQPELERWATLLRMMQTARDRDSLLELGTFATATGGMPPQLQMFMGAAMELLKGLPDAEPVSTGGPREEIREQVELAADDLLPLMELFAPGILRPEELERAVDGLPRGSWQEQTTAGLARFGMAMRTGDPEDLLEAAQPLLQAGQDRNVPPGMTAVLQAALLAGASLNGGNIEDAKAAQRLLTENIDLAALADGMASGTAGREFMETGRALLEYQRVCDTAEDDLDGFDDIDERLLAMRQELSADSGSASVVLFVLGFLQLRRTMAIGRAGGAVAAPLRRALMYLRESKEHPGMPMALRGIVAPVGAMCKALEQYIDPAAGSLLDDVEELRAALGGPRVTADQDIRSRLGMALVLDVEYDRRGDPAVLAAALTELEAARAEIGDHTGCGTAQDVYRKLADRYRRRGGPGDTARALEATERLLERVAEDVLLQIGAEHGLEAARAAAGRGVTAAVWAAESGDTATALRVLEAGRALVLRAAAASASVPEQLEASGETDLAGQWREAARAGADSGTVAAPSDADTLIPSTLRRRALKALRTVGVPAGPGWQEVSDAAEAAGVDAVVHLLVGQGDGPGRALVVRPGLAPLSLELTGLAAAERAPLERYVDAARDRSAVTAPDVPRSAPGRAEAVAAWEAALEELCEWAGGAVMGPVLDVVRPGRAARPDDPVRLVLLPAGNLGIVPWHAARLGAGTRAGERPVYAVDHAVISYAASGAEFVRSAARTRLPPAEAPVLVADPRATLAYAEHEVEALRAVFYPRARCFGFLSRNGFSVDGTPDELLPLLPGGTAERPATLVEFCVHGIAGDLPTVSRLLLHRPRGAVDDDAGLLTVRRLLGAPAVDGGGGAGPLVVLSACETDLSTRDHDETLTLTTAFVARGAADVIGSKWSVADASSAVLMYALHHFLAEGADPAQALRRAQLWALDADRPALPGLPGPLAVRINGKPALSADAWAPFIHQGNPAPVRPEGNTVGHR
ncbi:CHAT domain-containing protein [Streptomyces sp. NPDC006622]|uniref:CHAT domain-containing protein n=1 Tax=Streptomyces sp. NPDC006622 TaxID=3155459 RepID=UPI0033A45A1C